MQCLDLFTSVSIEFLQCAMPFIKFSLSLFSYLAPLGPFMSLSNALFSILIRMLSLSLFSFSGYAVFLGYSAALCCAPNDRVADCLAIILAHMSFAPSMSSTFCRSRIDNNNSTLGKHDRYHIEWPHSVTMTSLKKHDHTLKHDLT